MDTDIIKATVVHVGSIKGLEEFDHIKYETSFVFLALKPAWPYIVFVGEQNL
jgi:hypothetical protein